MYKKLIALVLTLAMVFCSGVPAFASEETAAVAFSAVSEDPFMPEGTEIPELPQASDVLDASDVTEEEDSVITDEETEAPAEEEEPAEEPEEEPAEEPEEEPAEEEEEEPAEEPAEEEEEEKETAAEKKARLKAEKYRNGLASYIRKVNPNLSKKWSRTLAQIFINAGEKYNLDPTVLMALAQRESTFRAKVTSPYGYKGMMQTSDSLARHYGYKPSELYKAKVSIDVASRYLRSLKKSFGTYTMALCGYMYGSGAVKKGNYSKKGAWAVMNTRDGIKEYLKKNDYV